MKTVDKSKLIFKSDNSRHSFVIADDDNWNCYCYGKLITKCRGDKYIWF